MATPPSTPLSVELRALIDQRNILTAKSKNKVLSSLDEHITTRNREAKEQALKSKIIEEIFTSEESYLKNLEIAMKFFRDGICEAKLTMPPQLKLLFDHLESLYKVNGELLNLLRFHGEDIGTAFKRMAPFFKLYSVYAFDYRAGLQSLQEVSKTNVKLDMFIKRQESRPEVHCKLSSLLISPIQRVPRYRLLLRQLLSHLPPDHPHYPSLKEGVDEVEKATRHIDSLVCEQETMGRMIELQKSLVGDTQLIQPGRKLIREGIVNKVSKKSDKSKVRYLILTSDVLMMCKLCGEKSLRCCQTLQLRSLLVQMTSDRLFNINCGASLNYDLYSSEPYASEAWVQAISSAVQQVTESEGTLKRGGSVRLALLRKDFNRFTDSLTPRKRKQLEEEPSQSHLHSPWKRNRSRLSQLQQMRAGVSGSPGPSRERGRKIGYFSSFRKAISTLSHSLQRYWIPAITGKENSLDHCIT